ncbi:MAG: preprotein translocase subunit SecE [Saccharofermentans sp.]|nr:preprotein translocase subunit SecE [Saccharofermentans sp.]
MADKSKKNVFQRIGMTFKEVRQELKKSVWPSKEKLRNTSAVVLAVIVFFAVFLSFIAIGGRWILDKVNFYDEVEPSVTAATEVTAAPVETVAAEDVLDLSETEVVEETVEETVESEA